MEDFQIIQLLFDRSEKAIEELSLKFGKYCNTIAFNILADSSDAEECLNDTWLKVWNSVPPQKPGCLKAFVGRITRNAALDCLDRKNSLKRGSGQAGLALEELDEVVGKDSDPLESLQAEELAKALNVFLERLPSEKRKIFMRRYWYFDSVKDIAQMFSISEAKVKTTLFRIREQLKEELKKEGFEI